MKRNSIKIVSNPYTNKMQYYFKNEIGEWKILLEDSPLSRQHYTDTSMEESANEILEKIDEIYNRKNKGVDILFEGATNRYKCLQKAVNDHFADHNIQCELGTTKIAVVGKKAVGKTALIEGLEELRGFQLSKADHQNYVQYFDNLNHDEWFEVSGIDLGKENIEKAFQTVKKIAENGLSAVIYCISGTSGRIEDIEKELIMRLIKDFSALKVMVVLTMCYQADMQETADEIKRFTNQVEVVPTLAKEYKTRARNENGASVVIEPFGLESVAAYVFEER